MAAQTPHAARRVAAVRRFNRFYTQRLGVLQQGWLDSAFSLTEARVLYEIRQRQRATASDIARELRLDAGYLSRILRRFHRRGLIRRQVSRDDARQSFLSMTARGRKAFAPLEARTEREVGAVLGRLSLPQQDHLLAAMHAIETLTSERKARSEIALRQPRPGDLGWVVARHGELYAREYGWAENFGALCAQIVADFAARHDPRCERCWIAEMDRQNVGSVFLVRDSEKVARLRLLLVDPVASRIARAQAYPSRPVRIIVGVPPGGGIDIMARLISQWLSERIGQQFIVENRPGAGTNIATEAVVRAPADGYTLLLVTAANAINTTLYEKLNFSFIRDIAPIAGLIVVPNVMLVNPSVPAKTIPEFIAYAKANPGKINIASGPIGGPSHVTAELFKMMTGTDMLLVSYRGVAPAAADLLGGQVQVMFNSLPASIEHIKASTLRALAVTTATRSETLPGIPTMGEFVPGFEASQWYGVGAPKNTPPQIIDKLNEEINAGFGDPKMKTRLADLGGTVLAGSPADFGKLIAEETEKWGKVVKFVGIKAD
jgi:tripartite-type tricarboxylate transporter receptor subunit TctC/DNA-binding MarR family transcriptional regulator